MTVQEKSKKPAAVAAFALMLLIWYATVSHDTLGFVPPDGPQAVGFDSWTVFIWLAFLYSGWHLWRGLRKDKTDGGGGT